MDSTVVNDDRGGRRMFSKFSKRIKRKILEKSVLETYAKGFARIPLGPGDPPWREQVKMMIELCKKQAKEEGTEDMPENLGEVFLELSLAGSSDYKTMVDKAYNDGATIGDFREFWNLPDLGRRMIFKSEDIFRYSSYLAFKEDGLTADEAMAKVRKTLPMYGDPEDQSNAQGDNRPLTQELRGRVDAYREKHRAEATAEKVKRHSSFNAFVRDEIRKGNL
jgi:uncharacterized protein YifE (UPF0438 family)